MRDHLTHSMISLSAICTTLEDTVADPDLQIGGGGGGGSSIREALGVKKNILWPFGPQFGLTKKGGRVPLGRSPGSATDIRKVYDELSEPKTWNYMFK